MADFALSELFDAVAQVAPERECIVQAEVRLSYADVQARSRRLASYLAGAAPGARRALDARRLGVGARSRRALSLQRPGVSRGDARLLPSARGAVQRQLPLRRE